MNQKTLKEILGDDGVVEHAPIEVDGVGISLTLRPADGEALAALLTEVGHRGESVIVRGGGNRLGFGHPPSRADAFLSTELLAGVIEFDPDEGVCHVAAGTRLTELRAQVNAEGWDVPLDPPGSTSTVGGTLAAAAVGPRTQGFGLPRDIVLGYEVALANGERTHCGGRVVKNVTGYDLNKLYTGSFGTLGVIEATWLRLRPRPERTAVFEAAFDKIHEAVDRGVAASRRSSSRAAVLQIPIESAPHPALVVELAGDAESVERDSEWLVAELGATAAGVAVLDAARDAQAAVRSPAGLRFRIAALPSRMEPALAELSGAGAQVLAYPGLGLIYAGYALPRESDGGEVAADDAFRRVDRVSRESGGAFLCEAAPVWAKRGRDVFGALTVALPLIKTLKAGFDPDGVLNPGRFVGRI